MTHNKREEFLQAVGNLTARGGGDCPELTYEGILEALNAGPRYGSPMFVFTDASAKDDTPTNVISAKVVAQATGTNINFFTHPLACGKRMGGFREIASFTSGQVFPLKKSKEITQFSSFVSNSLHGYTLIGSKSSSNYVPTGKCFLYVTTSRFTISCCHLTLLNVMSAKLVRKPLGVGQ